MFPDAVTQAGRDRRSMIMFDDEDEYARFNDQVWDQIDADAIEMIG